MKSILENRKTLFIASLISFLILGLYVRNQDGFELLGFVLTYIVYILLDISILFYVVLGTVIISEKFLGKRNKFIILLLLGLFLYLITFFIIWRNINFENLFSYFGNRLSFSRIVNNLRFYQLLLEGSALVDLLVVLLGDILYCFNVYLALGFLYIYSKNKQVNDSNFIQITNIEDLGNELIISNSFCQNCGVILDTESKFCPSCGQAVNKSSSIGTIYAQQTNTVNLGDQNSSGFNALSFFFPIIGLILYLVWKEQYPVKSKGIGKWAIIGAIAGFVFGIIYYLSVMSLINSLY